MMRHKQLLQLALLSLATFLGGSAFAGSPAWDIARKGSITELQEYLSQGGSANVADENGNTLLMNAAIYAEAPFLRALLEAGANPNTANRAGATPLMRAAGSLSKIELLVKHGASVNARSALGNTPLLLAARPYGSSEAVRLLLDQGANVNATNVFGATPLMAACAAGDVQTVRILLEKGADVNANPAPTLDGSIWGGGRSPLMWAAFRGNLELAELLLKHGAMVNAPAGFGHPLSQAAWSERTPLAEFLLAKGADPNLKEPVSGFTALHWAASSETGSTAMTKLLLDHGADPNAMGGENIDAYMGVVQTPLMLAQLRGETEIVELLRAAGAKGVPPRRKQISQGSRSVEVAGETIRAAIKKAIPTLETTALSSRDSFLKHASKQDCLSCHQQFIPSMALSAAERAGLPGSPAAAADLLKLIERDFQLMEALSAETTFHPEPAAGYGYALFALKEAAAGTTPAIDAAVQHLALIQDRDGSWRNNLQRPPIQASDVSATALSIRALRDFPFPARQTEFNERIARAGRWLWKVKPANTEERAYQLLGLSWAGEPAAKLASLASELAAEQRPDGGWSQLPALESDSYATGQALYALRIAAAHPIKSEPYQRGLKFLLGTQLEDGSWFVARRAFPFQPTMRSGYPHSRDSWISATGASWAVMALSGAYPELAAAMHAEAAPSTRAARLPKD